MTQTDPEEPGQFEIHYRGSDDTLSYWVLALGPIDSRGVYSYAIISNPSGDSLWVLARNVTEFFSLYNDEVMEKLEQLDYKNETSGPTVTYQGSDCEYEDMTPMMPVSELSVPQYMGLWYEMYTDDFVESAWENNTYCQQKNYALREDGVRISVHNYHAVGAPDGASSTMTGEFSCYTVTCTLADNYFCGMKKIS
jgi:lipocalin